MDYIKPKTGAVSQNFVKHCNEIGQLIYWHKECGKSIQVRQHKQLRWLLINHILQSVIEKGEPEHLLFPHLQTLSELWRNLDQPNSVLELGLGGGAIRNYIQHIYPETEIITLENNPDVIHCYKKYFGGTHSKNLHCQDAITELKTLKTFDWIILDLFSQIDAPIFLFQKNFYDMIYHVLNEQGWLFINFLAEHESQLIQLKKILTSVFNVSIHDAKIPHYTNHIFWLQK